MDGELEQLGTIAAGLRRVDALGVEVAEGARAEVLVEAQRTAAAGTTPDGEAWRPKNDGGRALPNAAGAIAAVVSGASSAVLVLILSGNYVYHHVKKSKAKRRAVLFDPANGVPARMVDAFQRSAARAVARAIGGGR